MNTLQWWGYLHVNGNVQVKRFFDHQDLDEALESPFVSEVVSPFYATGREDAIKHASKHFGVIVDGKGKKI